MKTILSVIISLTFASTVSTLADGKVVFANRVSGTFISPVFDVDGSKLSGPNFWTQLFAAPDLSATAELLTPVGVPTTFRTGASLSGTVDKGPVTVTPVSGGPASVQMRAWTAPFTSYDAAKNGGGRIGESRIMRMTNCPDGLLEFPPYLVDASGPMESFSLVGLPMLTINDIVLSEGTNGNISAVFTVTLAGPSTQTVTVAYATVDGTATAGSDYVATSGTLTFSPGQSNKTITVTLTPDPAPEPNETFSVQLSNATNCSIIRSVGTCTIAQDVVITGLSVDVGLTFTTVQGRTYALEKSANPQTGIWTGVPGATNIAGNGGAVTVYDKGAGCNSGGFYRVRIVQ